MNAYQKGLMKLLGTKKKRIWVVRSKSNPGKTYPIVVYINKQGNPSVKHGECLGFRFRRMCHHFAAFCERHNIKAPPQRPS